jgi:hypothetical protein
VPAVSQRRLHCYYHACGTTMQTSDLEPKSILI